MTKKRKRGSRGSGDRPPKAKQNNGEQCLNVSVSDTLHTANAVLYDFFDGFSLNDSVFGLLMAESSDNTTVMDKSEGSQVSQSHVISPPTATPSDTPAPSCTDIMNYLKLIDSKIVAIDKRLCTLDKVEKQVSAFDSELKKLRTLVYDNNKEIHEKTNKMADEIGGLQISLTQAQDEISKLKHDKVKMKDDLLYVQSQSMRNNLLFANIPESAHEKPDDCEKLVRQFMADKLQLAQDIVDSIGFERVHRTLDRNTAAHGKPRHIVAKFSSFKDRELVRRAKGKLKGTQFFIFEQFPKEVADRRRSLMPKLKQAIRDGNRAWLSYDTLYIDGRPVRDDGH